MQARFEPGLIGTGPIPIHMGHPTPWSEGSVIRIESGSGSFWTANLQAGYGYANKVVNWEAADAILVIAKGACYLVRPETPNKWNFICNLAIECVLTPNQNVTIVSTYTDVIALRPDGTRLWKRSVAMDGVRIDKVDEQFIVGAAGIDPPDDWQKFKLSVLDGKDA